MSRLISLDVFRGSTVAFMILVNTPGSWNHIYAPFKHASWHGCTVTDFVFPFFLFIVGASLFLSQSKTKSQRQRQPSSHDSNSTWHQLSHITKRASIMFLIGVLLNAFPFNEPIQELRVMGVLQRIALAYWFAGIFITLCGSKYVCEVIVSTLLIYWGLLYFAGGEAPYSLQGNIIREMDLTILGESHMWQGLGIPFEPEGLLSTLPAIASLLIGYQATRFVTSHPNVAQATIQIAQYGIALIIIGLVWDRMLPINKSLWTSSYVVYTSGYAFLTLAFTVYLIDIKRVTRPVYPLVALGANPLFIYVLSWLWVECYWLIPDRQAGNLYTAIFEQLNNVLEAKLASFTFAIIHVFVFTLIAIGLHKRKLHVKI